VTFSGIEGYEPRWLAGRDVRAAHGGRLAALEGRRRDRAWLLGDLDDHTWFADGPVLLDFEGEQAELRGRGRSRFPTPWTRTTSSSGRRIPPIASTR
jgi:hypothetical protein